MFLEDAGPYLVPAGVLGEVTYLIEHRLGSKALDVFLEDLVTRAYALDCGAEDFPRVRELVRRHEDLPLGFVDACVIACAERNGGRVLTLDARDFRVVSGDGTITVVLV